MTIDEAIKDLEQLIVEFEAIKKFRAVTHEDYKCVEKECQFVEWLKELKHLRELTSSYESTIVKLTESIAENGGQLGTNLASLGTDDCISRKWCLAEYDRQHVGPPGGARKIIEEAPSILPTQMSGTSDAVSRRMVLDALHEYMDDTNYTVGYLHDVICNLPSAQPEIIRCKDCKHFEYDHPYIIQGIPVLGHEVCMAWGDRCKTDENGYCFMAERRADG